MICLLLEEKNNILEGEIVNLSSGVSLTLRELTSLISDRVEVVLDFKPVINFNLKKQAKKTKPLVISNEKLEKTCGKVNSDLSGEIDQLLLNCVQWFNAEKQ